MAAQLQGKPCCSLKGAPTPEKGALQMREWGGGWEAEARSGVAAGCSHTSPPFLRSEHLHYWHIILQGRLARERVQSQLTEQFSSLLLPLRPSVRFAAELGLSCILGLEIRVSLGRVSASSHHVHVWRFGPQH